MHIRTEEGRVAVGTQGFPHDPDFPHLIAASDPGAMLEIFREHLRPIRGRTFFIEDCVPFRFRCRQSVSRCVLQYTLRLVEPDTGHRREQWVTGLLHSKEGEAERVWRELRAADPGRDIPERWQSFEPLDFIPELDMVVEVFPFDRRLPQLRAVLGGALGPLETLLRARRGPGRWRAGDETLEPTRYRTELGAAFRCSIPAREARSGREETLHCYVKVFRNHHAEETYRLLHASARRPARDRSSYALVSPLLHRSDLRTLVLEEAPGASMQQQLLEGCDPAAIGRRAAQAVAAFHRDDLEIHRHRPVEDDLADVRRAADAVAWACPEFRDEVEAIAREVLGGLEDVALSPVHGDLKPDHVFLDGDRVTLIDLDSAALGDPTRDAAQLYAYLMGGVGLESVSRADTLAAADAFVEAYFACVPCSWRRRFAKLCAGALLEVAWAIFRHQEACWAPKVTAAVEEAGRALSEMSA